MESPSRDGHGSPEGTAVRQGRLFYSEQLQNPVDLETQESEQQIRMIWDEYKNILIETSNHIISQDFERSPGQFLDIVRRQNSINERLVKLLKDKEEAARLKFQPEEISLKDFTKPVRQAGAVGGTKWARSPSESMGTNECDKVMTISPVDFKDESKWQLLRLDENVELFFPNNTHAAEPLGDKEGPRLLSNASIVGQAGAVKKSRGAGRKEAGRK